MFKLAIPVLHVRSSVVAEEFYCKRLGFHREFAYRVDEGKPDPCYMGLVRDEAWLHISSFSGDGVSGGVVWSTGPVSIRTSFSTSSACSPSTSSTSNRTWGTREMYVRDADGNSLRFICPMDG